MNVRAVALFSLAFAAPASAQSFWFEGGAGASSGAYFFEETVTSWSGWLGLAVESGPVTLRVMESVSLQNSTVLSVTGSGLVPSGGTHAGVVRDSGMAHGRRGRQSLVEVPQTAYLEEQRLAAGDPVASALVRLLDGATGLNLGAAAKIPLADTSDFGTGEWDVGVSASISRRIGRSSMAALDASWWHLGDLPDIDFRDPVNASGSLSHASGDWVVMGGVGAGTSAIRGYDPPVSLFGSGGRALDRSMIMVQGSVGLTETVPDFTLGLGWRILLH